MVQINRSSILSLGGKARCLPFLVTFLSYVGLSVTIVFLYVCLAGSIETGLLQMSSSDNEQSSSSTLRQKRHTVVPPALISIGHLPDTSLRQRNNQRLGKSSNDDPDEEAAVACSYRSLNDLTPSERSPSASKTRHMVTPPSDRNGTLTLVCCSTTKGPLSIAVHSSWAPYGATRFLDMVSIHYFSSRVAMMRCIPDFLCQFGIAGDPQLNKQILDQPTLPDDSNWLPPGPKNRQNRIGVRRFSKGYLAYAGSGTHSRSNQFIIALTDQGRLGGGSPWEVPWGELVGTESFTTLDKIYTGYGDNGPSQELLTKEGSSVNVTKHFPNLDYITKCQLLDQRSFS